MTTLSLNPLPFFASATTKTATKTPTTTTTLVHDGNFACFVFFDTHYISYIQQWVLIRQATIYLQKPAFCCCLSEVLYFYSFFFFFVWVVRV